MTNHTETDIWITSASADALNHDQEVDLGDGWHALVFPYASGLWGWELWGQWMHSDEDGENDPVKSGISDDENMAKAAALIAAAHCDRFPR